MRSADPFGGRREEVLRPPRRDLDDELSLLSHELSERLTAIAVYVEAARRLLARLTPPGGEKLAEILGKASAQAGRAGEIVRRLHQLAAPGAPQPRHPTEEGAAAAPGGRGPARRNDPEDGNG